MTAADNGKKEKDSVTGIETTGHEWDGLKELNNPAPRWWLWVFYVTIVWSVGYWVVYPAWPTLENATQGRYGWTQYGQLAEKQAEIAVLHEKYAVRFKTASLEEIKNDPELFEYAYQGGQVAFKNNCAACHGTGAAGGNGYPNLNDDDWLWGGKLDDVYNTVRYGIRSGHEEARYSMMPAFGTEGLLSKADISAVADHVLSLSGRAQPDARGAAIFAEQCAACHGVAGTGDRSFGAPNLADALWLYGGDKSDIVNTVSRARNSVMPNWNEKLPDATIKQLAIYVHSLGGGE